MSGDLPSFSQAQGIEEIPPILELGELPKNIRNRIWSALYRYLMECTGDGYDERYMRSSRHLPKLMEELFLKFYDVPYDLLPKYEKIETLLRKEIYESEYNRVFDLILVILRSKWCGKQLVEEMAEALNDSNSAYTMQIDPPLIMPRLSNEEAETIKRALDDLAAEEFSGARKHLTLAADFLAQDENNQAVRESIHAVESVARVLDDGAATSLKPALDSLEKKGVVIHRALRKAWEAMYGYTSDKNGIRHALLDDDEVVDQIEARFMIGACASFVSYLIGKSKEA